MPTNERGIIFSFDALLAVIVLSLFVASLAFLSSRSSEDNLGKLLLNKQSSDLLLAMDKSGLLSGMDENRINQTLMSALPQDTNYALALEYYNYSGTGGAFETVFSASMQRGNSSNSDELDASQRVFVVARAPQPPLYGVARLQLWKA